MKKAFYFLIRIHLKLRQKIGTYEESILFSYKNTSETETKN
jgi:hypothetical protein